MNNKIIQPENLKEEIRQQFAGKHHRDKGLGKYLESLGKAPTNQKQSFAAIENAVRLLDEYVEPLGLKTVFVEKDEK